MSQVLTKASASWGGTPDGESRIMARAMAAEHLLKSSVSVGRPDLVTICEETFKAQKSFALKQRNGLSGQTYF